MAEQVFPRYPSASVSAGFEQLCDAATDSTHFFYKRNHYAIPARGEHRGTLTFPLRFLYTCNYTSCQHSYFSNDNTHS